MDKVIEIIISWIQKNLKNPKLYAALVIVITVIILFSPYIDANFFFYNRIEKRVSILQSLSEIDVEQISQSPALQKEYNAIISEITTQRELSISNVIFAEQTTKNVLLFKFLSGGALMWIIALCIPFMNTFKNKTTKILALIFFVIFGGIVGWIGYIIPSFSNPLFNYIGFPILQLIMLIALVIKPKQE